MDNSAVEADLLLRIEQSREWILDANRQAVELKFRGRNWNATPKAFLDDPKRVERYGVSFEFALDDKSKEHKVVLNVRIKPIATIGENGDSPPYVVAYVTNQQTGKDEAIGWHHIEVPAAYAKIAGLQIGDWYKKWISHALTGKGSKKIFEPAMRLNDVVTQ